MTTPLQLIAIAGLYQNTGFAANTAMLASVSSFESLSLIAPLLQARIAGGTANIAPGNTARFSNATIANLNSLGSTTCSALADNPPSTAGTVTLTNTAPGVTGAVTTGANIVIPTDLTKFMQIFSAAVGYVSTTNRVINTSRNSATFLGPTFSNMTALTTGDVSAVNSNIQAFGSDLARLGTLIDLAALGNLGSPSQLLRQLIKVGGLTPGVLGLLVDTGVAESEVTALRDGNYELSDSLQNLAYRAMTKVVGDELQQVLDVFDITTTGIQNMAELLNPVKIFPNCFQTFTTPTTIGLQNIYINAGGTVNSNLLNTLPKYLIEAVV